MASQSRTRLRGEEIETSGGMHRQRLTDVVCAKMFEVCCFFLVGFGLEEFSGDGRAEPCATLV